MTFLTLTLPSRVATTHQTAHLARQPTLSSSGRPSQPVSHTHPPFNRHCRHHSPSNILAPPTFSSRGMAAMTPRLRSRRTRSLVWLMLNPCSRRVRGVVSCSRAGGRHGNRMGAGSEEAWGSVRVVVRQAGGVTELLRSGNCSTAGSSEADNRWCCQVSLAISCRAVSPCPSYSRACCLLLFWGTICRPSFPILSTAIHGERRLCTRTSYISKNLRKILGIPPSSSTTFLTCLCPEGRSYQVVRGQISSTCP
jgi:hypothetical protein